MRRYKLSLSPTASLEFSTAWIDELRSGSLRIVQSLFARLAVLAIGLLPLLLVLNYANVARLEAEQLYLLLVVAAFLIACALGTAFLVGMRYFADPPLFMYVLIFSLSIIATYLVSLVVITEVNVAAAVSQANTFGNPTQKLLSGVFIMAAVALFYGVNTFINTGRKLRIVINIWILSLALGALALWLDPTAMYFLEPTVFVGLISLFLAAVFAANRYVALGLLASIVAGAVALLRQGVSWEYFFAMIVSFVAWIYIYSFARDWDVLSQVRSFIPDMREAVDGKQRLGKFVSDHVFPLAVMAFTALILATGVWILQHRVNIVADLSNWAMQVKSIQTTLSADWQAAFVGVGAATSAKLTNTLLSVLQYNGAIGLIAYILVMVSALMLVVKGMVGELRNNARFKPMNILFPFALGIPIVSLFINLPINTAIFWWLAISMAAASSTLGSRRTVSFTKMDLKFRGRDLGRFMPVVQLILIVATIVLWVVLSQALWQLVARGTV